jgi:hypothetical protein
MAKNNSVAPFKKGTKVYYFDSLGEKITGKVESAIGGFGVLIKIDGTKRKRMGFPVEKLQYLHLEK